MTNIDDQWPEQDFESVPNCPMCGQRERTVLYTGLQDYIFRAAEGKWNMYKCSKCSIAYLDPRPTPGSIGRAYTSYYTHSKNDEFPFNQKKSILQTIIRGLKNGYINHHYQIKKNPEIRVGRWLIPLIPPIRSVADCSFRHITISGSTRRRLLDIGCGNGSYLLLAQEAGWDVEGLDFDPEAVKICLAAGLNVRVGGIEILQDKKNFYDAITLSHVIEHVHEPAKLLNQILALLKPGGMLWLATPNIDSLLSRRYGSDWRGLEPPRHLVLFNRESLYFLLHQTGFSEVKQHYDMAARFIMAQSEGIKFSMSNISTIKSYQLFSSRSLWIEFLEIMQCRTREYLVFTAKKRA